MEEKKPKKISLSTFFLIIAIIVIIVMGFVILNLYKEKKAEEEKVVELQAEIEELNETANKLQDTIDTVAVAVNKDEKVENTSTSVIQNDEVEYTITTNSETEATIKATKNGKSVSKEIYVDCLIAKTGTMELPYFGKVALISESGGEYLGVHVYGLKEGVIQELGCIDLGVDTVIDATYNAEKKDEVTVSIKAQRGNETMSKEFEMSALIANIEVMDVLDYGEIVFVSETGGEYYGIQCFRLSRDITNKLKEIKNVGILK